MVGRVISDTMDARASVCMTVYNGASFLLPQLDSILLQLRPTDEIVIVDDASQDASSDLLRSVSDRRVRVIRNHRNLGVLASFERALRVAQGDILFLSDQDDLWLPGKIRTIMGVFASRPEVTLTLSDAKLIDANDVVIANSYLAQRGGFASGVLRNLFRNRYVGCTMAFRRSMLEAYLPIPPNVPMHDVWFGILNELYGMTHYIDVPLIAYRRHSTNVSPASRASLWQGLVWRWHLARHLCARVASLTLSR